jgi:hypothetical protein
LWAGGIDVFIGLTAVPLAFLVANRGEQDVGAGGRGGYHPLAQLVEERGEDRSRGVRGGGGRACAYELERVAGKGPVLQPALAHEIGEPVVCGQRHLVACLVQPLTQARERRDITSRTRCHDQNPHQASPVVPLRFSAAALPIHRADPDPEGQL